MARLLLFLGILVASATADASTIEGQGRAIDGDSLMVGTDEIRLYGVDAPELAQTCRRGDQDWFCGWAAKEKLTKLIGPHRVTCTPVGQDRYGRTLARCRAGELDLNRVMVATGYALAYRRYSVDYVSAEESAKLARRGIWASTFELPSEVRQVGVDYSTPPREQGNQRSDGLPKVARMGGASSAGGACRIKGNKSRRGGLIYHLPGMPYYEQTRAEQMFCTEAEARAAGYRRSRADQHR